MGGAQGHRTDRGESAAPGSGGHEDVTCIVRAPGGVTGTVQAARRQTGPLHPVVAALIKTSGGKRSDKGQGLMKVVVHACQPGTLEAEAGLPGVGGQPGLQGKAKKEKPDPKTRHHSPEKQLIPCAGCPLHLVGHVIRSPKCMLRGNAVLLAGVGVMTSSGQAPGLDPNQHPPAKPGVGPYPSETAPWDARRREETWGQKKLKVHKTVAWHGGHTSNPSTGEAEAGG